jgi:two-component system, NtrC family, sensor histidine kinase GlrK
MRLNIFSRLFASYFAIIIFLGMINAYSVWALHNLNTEVNMIFQRDRHILDLKERMANSLEAQKLSVRRFLIAGDVTLLDPIVDRQNEFETYLARMSFSIDAPDKKEILARIISGYEYYRVLVNKQIEGMRTRKGPSDLKESGIIAANISDDLNILQHMYERDIDLRMMKIQHTAARSQKISAILFAAAAAFMALGLFLNTRGITKPLHLLREKTREISQGVFKGDLSIASPSEVSELAGELNRMCEKLKEVDSMKSGFLAAMSHELRTPLASIKQGISLLKDRIAGPIPDKQKRIFTILTEETNRLIEIVNSLLELSKMEAGMMPFSLRYDDFPSLVRRVLDEMMPLIEAKRIVMEFDGQEKEIPPVRIGRERILQAVRNLIGNAVKFTPENGLISVGVYRKNESLEFSIHDTGPGIPEDCLEMIFEKFHQSPVRCSGPIKGTGLGLAFVKHIITAHGGSVWAQSEPGKGATFIFALPI